MEAGGFRTADLASVPTVAAAGIMDTTAAATIVAAESTSARRITTMIIMITHMRTIAAGFIAGL
jgi:hypothetical protein